MTYDKAFYDGKRQKIQEKFNKAQQKWIAICEMQGREYLSLQETIQECNVALTELQKEEEISKADKNAKKV